MRATYDVIERLTKIYGKVVMDGIWSFCTSGAIDADIRLDGKEYLYITNKENCLFVEVRPCLKNI